MRTIIAYHLRQWKPRLYKLLRMEGETARQEKTVAAGIDAGRGQPQSFHGVPLKSLSPSSWLSASKLLHTMGSFTLPSDKVCFGRLAVAVSPPRFHAFAGKRPCLNLSGGNPRPCFITFTYIEWWRLPCSLAACLNCTRYSRRLFDEQDVSVLTLQTADVVSAYQIVLTPNSDGITGLP